MLIGPGGADHLVLLTNADWSGGADPLRILTNADWSGGADHLWQLLATYRLLAVQLLAA